MLGDDHRDDAECDGATDRVVSTPKCQDTHSDITAYTRLVKPLP
jgi:hypothetical protein